MLYAEQNATLSAVTGNSGKSLLSFPAVASAAAEKILVRSTDCHICVTPYNGTACGTTQHCRKASAHPWYRYVSYHTLFVHQESSSLRGVQHYSHCERHYLACNRAPFTAIRRPKYTFHHAEVVRRLDVPAHASVLHPLQVGRYLPLNTLLLQTNSPIGECFSSTSRYSSSHGRRLTPNFYRANDLPVEIQLIRVDKMDHKKPDYLRLNPLGKVTT